MRLTGRLVKAFCLSVFALFFTATVFAEDISINTAPAHANFENNYFDANAENTDAKNRAYFYDPNEKTTWEKLKGFPTANRLSLAFFSLHLVDNFRHRSPGSEPPCWNNQMMGVSYQGYFIATMVNSHYHRAYAAGIERYWFTTRVNANFDYSFGYRLGLVTGYDEHTMSMARWSPVVPFPELMFDLAYKHAQLGLVWCFQIIGVELYYRF